MNKTAILIADDHQIVRQGLRGLIEAEPDFCVVGEVSDGLETLRLAERLSPDVLVLDLAMPGLHGLEVVRRIGRRWPKIRVIILSMHSNEHYILDALRNGALGYVFKDSCTDNLVRAIRDALAGRRYLPPPFSESAIAAYIDVTKRSAVDVYETLSNREREVLQLVVEGRTNAEVGNRLFISPRTVEAHRARLMRKLSLRNEADLIRYAFKKGLLSLQEPPGEPRGAPSSGPTKKSSATHTTR